jgi:DNA-binding NtrC family response regulator
MPGMDGLSLLSAIKADTPTLRSDVVLITGHGDMATAVDALRKGAYDYLNKPINARELSAVVDRCAERQALLKENSLLRNNMEEIVSRVAEDMRRDLDKARRRLREIEGIGIVIAESPAMRRLMHESLILHSDPTVPVLIEGETGTGKEIFARYIHYGDGGVETPFMAINCAAIPHELFESELFGHEPGAFTGSRADGAPGKLEQAGKGTLFLDEVVEMPLTLQPKLLRVLEERSFYRVGGIKKREFSARIVCAGNRSMADMVEKGTFRRDLYHRLQVGHLFIPPLRVRLEDIRPLAEHFLQREALRKKRNFAGIDSLAMETLEHYPWPGNVRELENTLERAVLMNDGTLLLPSHIQFLFQRRSDASVTQTPAETTPPCARNLDIAADQIELPQAPMNLDSHIDAVIMAAMKRFDGNKSKTADYLGISRFALHRRLQQINGK